MPFFMIEMDRIPISNTFVCVLIRLMPLPKAFATTSCVMGIRKNTIYTNFGYLMALENVFDTHFFRLWV